MRHTKLAQHLALLHPDEHRGFAQFLDSPYFGASQRSRDLYGVLRRMLMASATSDPREEAVDAALFPGQAHDQNRFRKACSQLLRHLEDFLALRAWEAEGQRGLHLLQRLAVPEAMRYFDTQADAQEAGIRALLPASGAWDSLFRLHRIRMARVGLGTQRVSGLDFQAMAQDLDALYCCERMALAYAAINEHAVTGRGEQPTASPDFLALVRARLHDLPLITRLHFHLYQLTLTPADESAWMAFRALFQDAALPDRDMEDILSAALNHCVRRINAGAAHFLEQMHELHQQMDAQGLYRSLPGILAPHFKNAVVTACRLQRLDWADAFIQRHGPQLRQMGAGIAADFAEGVVAYFRQHHRAAALALHRVLADARDTFYGLDARAYLMRVYLETDDIQGLESLSESFRMYLRRNNALSIGRRQLYAAFIRYVLQLSRIPAHDQEGLLRLLERVRKGRRLPVSDWLEGRILMRITRQ